MSGEWSEGQLFVWGDDGLEAVGRTAEAAVTVKPSSVRTARTKCRTPAVRIEAREEEPGITREAPRVQPARQRHTYSSDDDFCNDPEELEKRRRDREQTRSKPMRERPSLFARAIGALARRDYARRELAAKLRRGLKEDEDPDEVERVLDRLTEAGYLSDARFAHSRARTRSRTLGDARIRRELRQSGVSNEDANAAVADIEEPEELRAYRLWRRRFGELPSDRKERERQVRFLLYRGFSMGAVSRVLRGEVETPEDEY